MLITPHISEKSYGLAAGKIYVFDVPLNASKSAVKAAVKAQYPDVKVEDVRLAIIKGKVKAVNRGRRARPGKTTLPDRKKAYVTVSEGEIAVFKEAAESEAA
jgi:large subunit ribosomal protein L23